MQITFFVCNESTAQEFVYSQLASVNKTDRLCISKDLFFLKKDIQLYFKWDGIKIIFLETETHDFELIRNERLKEEEYILLTIQRERLLLRVFLDEETRVACCYTRGEEISVGRSAENSIVCPLPFFSDRHFTIKTKGNAELFVNGRNGLYVNHYFHGRHERIKLQYGDEILLFGIRLIWLKTMLAIIYRGAAAETLDIKLKLYESEERTGECEKNTEISKGVQAEADKPFSPAPRNRRLLDTEPVELELPPEKRELEKQPLLLTIGPAFTMALPMLLGFSVAIAAQKTRGTGSGVYMYTGLITALTSACLGGVWALLNVRHRNNSMLAAEEKRNAAYRAYVIDCERRIREKYRYNRNILLSTYPPLQEYLIGRGNPLLLWNRIDSEEDLYSYRLGTGTLAFEVPLVIPKERFSVTRDELKEFPKRLKQKYGQLKEVPVCIDLYRERLHGIVSDREENLLELMRLLALTIGVTNHAGQVRLVFLFSKWIKIKEHLQSFRWLPHVWLETGYLVSAEEERSREIIFELEQYLKRPGTEHIIIFSDDLPMLGQELVSSERVSILLFAADYGVLPSSCQSIVIWEEGFSGWLQLKADSTFRREIYFDRIGASQAELYMRQLCGLHSGKEEGNGRIRDKVTIFEVLGIQRVSAADICESWKRSRVESSLSVAIGLTEGDRKCYLDAHEKGHGPHGLIAGMTGSGKSEILQTIVLSLSMKYSPQEVGFFLIDYKGGGMAQLFCDLPHLLGSISNLSGSMIYRAMVSIRSENERRQRLFLNASVNQIHDYQRLFRSGNVKTALPHIFIVIDEFAELKREEPDFMRELVSVAQLGRSLGIHLILATQKPAGTVDDNIWSNARFRICLRVQDRQDSSDMLHCTDAAYITNPGRAILQVGNDELHQLFQGAYTMEPYTGLQEIEAVRQLDEYGRSSSLYLPEHRMETAGNDTQIHRLLAGITQAAQHLEYADIQTLWLPPLAAEIYLEEVFQNEGALNEKYEIAVGRFDYPRQQRQGTFSISLSKGGHHFICGNAASGKSTFLQTILYAFLMKENPKTLQIYIIDYSSRMLCAFAESGMVGGAFTEEDTADISKLFYLLMELLQERKRLYGMTFPAILLVIDNYGSFREKTAGEYDSMIQELSKQGESYEIYLLLTASSLGGGELPNRLFENCRTTLCLTMNDKYQYCEALRTSQIKLRLPENMKGRGMAWFADEILEFQCARCLKAEDDRQRVEQIVEMIKIRNMQYGGEKAMKVPHIPDKPMLTEFIKELNINYVNLNLPIGYEERSGKKFVLPLETFSRVLITGKKRCGKKNCLTVIRAVAEHCGMFVFEALSVQELIQEMQKQEKGGIYFIPNLEIFLNEFYVNQYKKEQEDYLCREFGKNSLHKVIAVLELTGVSGVIGRRLFEVFREEVYGIHMGGALDGQNLLDFSNVPFSRQCVVKKAGHGTIPNAGYAMDVIFPRAENG